MENILQDDSKIKTFAKLQELIKDLKPNSDDAEIDNIISNIPANYLINKEDLMIICQLFTYFSRLNCASFHKNSIKLLQRIIKPIKTYLQDESSYFWSITGGLFYFKLWMYEKGLISIETIIQAAQEDDTFCTSEYFYPEILKEKPEIFENETKYKLKKLYSEEEKAEFIELRKRHFEWIMKSGDYNDPLYLQIESNPLRLSIKKDDVDTFQKILSKSNISINSNVQESPIENCIIHPREESLIEYAIYFNSVNISKFLILKNVELNDNLVFNSINSNNYEIIHIIESKLKKKFEAVSFMCSVFSWNDELIDYLIDNYNFDFFLNDDDDIPVERRKVTLEIIKQTFYSSNFSFLDSIILPFFRKKKKFVDNNIYAIISSTFYDMSGYFSKEFMKYPNIDINHVQNENENEEENDDIYTLLGMAVYIKNFKVFEYILSNYSCIEINEPAYGKYHPFSIACRYNLDIKFLEMLSNYPGFDVYAEDPLDGDDALLNSILNRNFYALGFIFNKFNDFQIQISFVSLYFYSSLIQNDFITLKILLNYLLKVKNADKDKLISQFKKEFSTQEDYNEELVDLLRKIANEI